MTETSPRLNLPFILPAQAQKHVTHNEALMLLDAMTQLSVIDQDVDVPPQDATDGQAFAIGDAPTGDWIGRGNLIAVRFEGGWRFVDPKEGWIIWDQTQGAILVRVGSDWQPMSGNTQNLTGLGVGTTSDVVNRLVVASPAVLFTHDESDGDQRLVLNKETTPDTTSLLFQTGFSGRAEMGLAGTDDFAIKVSMDGSQFLTAMAFDSSTGLASGAAVQSGPTDTTPGRLMRADYGYGPTNVVGTVAEQNGTPSGAVIERGETATGSFTRFADGTQICTGDLQLVYDAIFSLQGDWVFPKPFVNGTAFPTGILSMGQSVSTMTPSLNQVGAVMWGNSGDVNNVCRFELRRVSGTTSFSTSDMAVVRAMAIGRWF